MHPSAVPAYDLPRPPAMQYIMYMPFVITVSCMSYCSSIDYGVGGWCVRRRGVIDKENPPYVHYLSNISRTLQVMY